MADRDRIGYVLIDRNILEWKWWNKHNTLIVFLYLLLKANYHDSYFDGIEIKRGQVVVTHAKISQQSKLTIQQVRTSLTHLISTGEITIKRYPKFLVITISNYDRYQNLTMESPIDQQSSNNHSAKNQQYPKQYITNTEENKKKKKGRFAPENDFPKTVDEIIPERDLAGYPSADEMPCEADGTKRDIPDRVRHLFSDYDAYWRFRHR